MVTKCPILSHMSVVSTSSRGTRRYERRVSGSFPVGKCRGGICPAVLLSPALRLSHSVYSSTFSLGNTTVPNLHEVKENMTMGTTLVTNPNGGFLVRRKSLFALYTRTSLQMFHMLNTRGGPNFANNVQETVQLLSTFALSGNPGIDPPCFSVRLHVLGMRQDAGPPKHPCKTHEHVGGFDYAQDCWFYAPLCD